MVLISCVSRVVDAYIHKNACSAEGACCDEHASRVVLRKMMRVCNVHEGIISPPNRNSSKKKNGRRLLIFDMELDLDTPASG